MDCREAIALMQDQSINSIVTSPPYFGLRDYDCEGQIGLEQSPEDYINTLVQVFSDCRRILRDDGTLWIVIGDSYAAARGGTHQPAETLAGGKRGISDQGDRVNRGRFEGYNPTRNATKIGLKHKDLIGIPWRLAFALQADGWYLRQDIIWHKPNPMPESVKDRCTKSHEYIFMLSKKPNYFYDFESIKEPAVSTDRKKWTDNGKDKQRGHGRRHAGFNGRYADALSKGDIPSTRNRRDVWTVATKPFKEAHFATFPPNLILPCIQASCPENGTVFDPFSGAGTTALVALQNNRNAILAELNSEYVSMTYKRMIEAGFVDRLEYDL
jgi:DNA modification methylase